MAQITWATRVIQAGTLLGGDAPNFEIATADEQSIWEGMKCTYVIPTAGGSTRATRYVQPSGSPSQYRLSEDEDGNTLVPNVVGEFTLERDAAIITNHPRRPILVDPALVRRTTPSNPLTQVSWTSGQPRYEGQVTIEAVDERDVMIVESFIDQLADPDAWFELPLPGEHLGSFNVVGYNEATRAITIGSSLDENITGWFARVGARTARITSDTRTGNAHTITIYPNFITGTTSQNSDNRFGSAASVRARAVDVSATGSTDYEGMWTISWEETNRID